MVKEMKIVVNLNEAECTGDNTVLTDMCRPLMIKTHVKFLIVK